MAEKVRPPQPPPTRGSARHPGQMSRTRRAVASGAAAGLAVFQVTNLDDDGPGSLRQAIAAANGTAGPDDITFQAGLTGTILLQTGQLEITDAVDIQGPGPEVITVDGNASSRVVFLHPFYVYAAPDLPFAATISGLTITGGMNDGLNGGGGILIGNDIDLVLDDVVIVDNQSGSGGGVELLDGTLTMVDSLVTGNFAPAGGGISVFGGTATLSNSDVTGNGAIYVGGGIILYGGSVMVNEASVVSGNGTYLGGGIAAYYGTLDVVDSAVAGNYSFAGGGIAGFGDFTLQNSQVADNHAAVVGGGILALSGELTVERSTIDGNSAPIGGGVIVAPVEFCFCAREGEPLTAGSTDDAGGGDGGPRRWWQVARLATARLATAGSAQPAGPTESAGAKAFGHARSLAGIATPAARKVFAGRASGPAIRHRVGAGTEGPPPPPIVTFRESTISGNQAVMGAGALLYGADTLFENTTVSGNQAGATTEEIPLPPYGGFGGGIVAVAYYDQVNGFAGSLSLLHTTVTDNTSEAADCECGPESPPLAGGVLAINDTTIVNSLIGGNTAPDLSAPGAAVSHSLVQSSDPLNPFTDVGNNVVGQGPALGPLQDNGGPTATHLPETTSPAVDAGDDGNSRPTDQRGVTRPGGTSVDMGAVELSRGVVQFSVVDVQVDESAGVAQLTVARTDGGDGLAAVDFHTVDGSATAPADYLATSGCLEWGAGDTEPKTFEVTIVDDAIPDAGEIFQVVLENAREGACPAPAVATAGAPGPRTIHAAATLGPASTANVTILEGNVDSVVAVPTLGEYMQMLLATLLGAAGAWMLRRKTATARLTVRRR
jgi:hypothetical protein